MSRGEERLYRVLIVFLLLLYGGLTKLYALPPPASDKAACHEYLRLLAGQPPKGTPPQDSFSGKSDQTKPTYEATLGPLIEALDPERLTLDLKFQFYMPGLPSSGSVQIAGDFTKWTWAPMDHSKGNSIWHRSYKDIPAGSRYFFRFSRGDGEWNYSTDPMAYSYTKSTVAESKPMLTEVRFDCPGCQTVEVLAPFTHGKWERLNPQNSIWTLQLSPQDSHTIVQLRYRTADNRLIELSPDQVKENIRFRWLETVDLFAVVPHLSYTYQNPRPTLNQPLVVLETTLSGLLKSWKQGTLFPKNTDELDSKSLSERIRMSGIVQEIRKLEYNAVMFPIQVSLADLADYDWAKAYLVGGFGAPDLHVGSWREIKALIDAFYAEGILVIPDLIFVHGARTPSLRSIDRIRTSDGKTLYEDEAAYYHMDFGTWMSRLEDPIIRRSLVEMITRFVVELNVPFRLDYADGLILQYSKRPVNYGAIFLDELRAELKQHSSEPVTIGEAFGSSGNESVQRTVDVMYDQHAGSAARWAVLSRAGNGQFSNWVDIHRLADSFQMWPDSNRKPRLGYAFLHDELTPHFDGAIIREADPNFKGYPSNTDGAHVAQLALNRALEVFHQAGRDRRELLDHVLNVTLMIEAHTLFASEYANGSFGNASSTATLGRLDQAGRWDIRWEGHHSEDISTWKKETGLHEAEIIDKIRAHGARMIAIRKLFRELTPFKPQSTDPLRIYSMDRNPNVSVFSAIRETPGTPWATSLIIFNYGAMSFPQYNIPVPHHLRGTWEVAFDSGGANPVGTQLKSMQHSSSSSALSVPFNKESLVILRYKPGI